MFILASNSLEFPLFSKSGKASRGKISCCVEAWAYFSGLQWNEVGVGYGFPRPGLELVVACVKREGDSSNVLNTCNVMESCQSLSVPWRVGGRRRRVHCLQRVILYGEKRVWRERKANRLEREFLPVTFHFQVMRAVCWTKITGYSCFSLNSEKKYTKNTPFGHPSRVSSSDWTNSGNWRLTCA